MHFHLPKPLHGWREFAGEVGIIVVGVMIALGAEQVVEKMRWNGEVADARKSLDAQLADAKFGLERLQNQDCVERKLDRLDDLISATDRPTIYKVRLTPIRVWGTSTWKIGDGVWRSCAYVARCEGKVRTTIHNDHPDRRD